MNAFVPESFAEPIVSPDTATLFRRTPYISPSEYRQTPTAVGTQTLVPGGSPQAQEAALAAVISRASDWLDLICFHKADGTLAASPTTESGWIKPREEGSLALICNYKPILEVDALAVGPSPQNLANIGATASKNITIQDPIIWLQSCGFGPIFPGSSGYSIGAVGPNGKVYVVWIYVNGYPHTSLAEEAKAGEDVLHVEPSNPGESKVYGVYENTQLTIHDGANTEVIVVSAIEGLTLKLTAPLAYDHTLPEAPNTTRVSAVPWAVEQACISLTSFLIKNRGSRAMVLPSSPGGGGSPPKQEDGQAGGMRDFDTAYEILRPFITPFVRSSS
jgi:hypothetical protein